MKFTLKDVLKLDHMVPVDGSFALQITRRVIDPDGEGDITVYAWANSNARGDRWHDCRAIRNYPNGSGLAYDHFEVVGKPSYVAKVISREARDLANEKFGGS